MTRPLLLVLGLLFVYNANLRQVSSGDTYASRFVPISLLRDGDLILDEFVPPDFRAAGPDRLTDNFILVRGHYYDSHPPVGPFLALPVYAIPALSGVPANQALVANAFSKLAASIMAALSALAIFAAVKRILADLNRPSEGIALLTAVVYGVCTSIWSTASLAMWSHTPTILCYAVAIWALSAGWTATAGFVTVAGVMSRPATAAGAFILLLYVLHQAIRHRSREQWIAVARCAAAAAIAGVLAAAYNLWLLGNVMGGARLRTEYWMRELNASSMFSGSILEGLAGLTVSPSYGLFIFTPVVVIAIIGAVDAWRTRRPVSDATLLMRYTSLAALSILLTYSKFIAWWGGHGFGPRYLTDAMPFVGALLGVGFASIRTPQRWPVRTAIAALVIYSAFIQAVGAFCWPSPWTLRKDPPPHHRLWDWRDNQIVSSIRSGPKLDPAAERLFAYLRKGLRN